jgi:hypothetical protein
MDPAHRTHGKCLPIGPAIDSEPRIELVDRHRREVSDQHFSDPGHQLLVMIERTLRAVVGAQLT